MPFDGSAGYGRGTPRKQEDFQHLHALQLRLSRQVMKRNDWAGKPYFYVDLTAGPGEVDGLPGSPIIAARTLAEEGGEWHASVCESDHEAFERLRGCIARLPAPTAARIRLYHGDHRQAVSGILNDIRRRSRGLEPFGLVYADPNGTLFEPEIETVCQFARAFPRLDILMYLSAAATKRWRKYDQRPSLKEKLERIEKKHMLIREPSTAAQFSFVLLTNWPDYPEWKRRGFYDANSEAGRTVFDRLNLTTEELKAVTIQESNQAQEELPLW